MAVPPSLFDSPEQASDPELKAVADDLTSLDPDGTRISKVLRRTYDMLLDGQHTGRYRWDQLYKTEKTHFGTLVEINLQREFGFADGKAMDFAIRGIDVDCKYSQDLGDWMIPPEALGHIILGLWASDNRGTWSLGLVRADDPLLTASRGRLARQRIISRTVVATVAQQEDYMKRVRGNGGSRSSLRPEGIVIIGQYESHKRIAQALRIPVPGLGESVSVRLARWQPDHAGLPSVIISKSGTEPADRRTRLPKSAADPPLGGGFGA